MKLNKLVLDKFCLDNNTTPDKLLLNISVYLYKEEDKEDEDNNYDNSITRIVISSVGLLLATITNNQVSKYDCSMSLAEFYAKNNLHHLAASMYFYAHSIRKVLIHHKHYSTFNKYSNKAISALFEKQMQHESLWDESDISTSRVDFINNLFYKSQTVSDNSENIFIVSNYYSLQQELAFIKDYEQSVLSLLEAVAYSPISILKTILTLNDTQIG